MDFTNLNTPDIIYLVISSVLIIAVLLGIFLMSKVKKSRLGNGLSAISMLLAIILVLIHTKVFDFSKDTATLITGLAVIFLGLLTGSIIGYVLSKRVKMIQMPQMVALLNGLGGIASALVGIVSFALAGKNGFSGDIFTSLTSSLAVSVGLITLFGSLVAAGKLHRLLPQKPIILKNHQALTISLLCLTIITIILSGLLIPLGIIEPIYMISLLTFNIVFSTLFGIVFSIRVGGADMPITISLLNSLSGVAGAIAGLALHDMLLVAIGGIVGASGLILTQIMCKAINRKLFDILFSKGAKKEHKQIDNNVVVETKEKTVENKQEETKNEKEEKDELAPLREAKDVIIVPGYGMAIAQAQHLVKKMADYLVSNGTKVRYAIHPVAGRMPGHMNVLLCEADVDYEDLFEMSDINDDFKSCDAVIVIGANDVLNPAANTLVNTPIYGMPVLNVNDAKQIYIFNYDTKPGYAGVDNPIYKRENGVHLFLGNASDTLAKVLEDIKNPSSSSVKTETKEEKDELAPLREAKDVIIVPGYGMAIAQAQHLVKKMADYLVSNGTKVRYAIHPVAGRMPGHMNVLLCEADVDYEDLFEMSDINDDFKSCDAVIVIGANDVLNPAANTLVNTPIYGMPVLNVNDAKQIYIFNYDTKPGYAGVDNPIYKRENGVHLFLGNASDTITKVLNELTEK